MSFATDQVTRLQTLIQANVGVMNVTVGGRSVAYTDLLKQYDYWTEVAARECGKRPRQAQINLGNW